MVFNKVFGFILFLLLSSHYQYLRLFSEHSY